MAVLTEGRSKSEVARGYQVSRYWVQLLVARYLAEGEAAFESRSSRPLTNPNRISELRKELDALGTDAGSVTTTTTPDPTDP